MSSWLAFYSGVMVIRVFLKLSDCDILFVRNKYFCASFELFVVLIKLFGFFAEKKLLKGN